MACSTRDTWGTCIIGIIGIIGIIVS